MRKRLERFGEVGVVDETNGFGLDFLETIDGSSTLKKDGFGIFRQTLSR